MSNDYDDRNKKKSSRPKKRTKTKEDSAFHFSAFVPISGHVWKLDGLDNQPSNLGNVSARCLQHITNPAGNFSGDWMNKVRPTIEDRIANGNGNLNYTLLSLCRSPLLTVSEELAVNIKTLSAIETRLSEIKKDWKMFVGWDGGETLRVATDNYKVTSDMLDRAEVDPEITKMLANLVNGVEQLFILRGEFIGAQNTLRTKWMEEMVALDDDNKRAASRRHDYTPMIHAWIQALADNGVLKDICESINK